MFTRSTQQERADATLPSIGIAPDAARFPGAGWAGTPMPIVRAGLVALCFATATGCAPMSLADEKGSIHYVVLGFGIVSVPKPSAETAVLATKLQAIGVTVSNQPGLKFNAGYTESSLVAVPDRAEDVRVEVSQSLGGPVVVDLQSAILREMNSATEVGTP